MTSPGVAYVCLRRCTTQQSAQLDRQLESRPVPPAHASRDSPGHLNLALFHGLDDRGRRGLQDGAALLFHRVLLRQPGRAGRQQPARHEPPVKDDRTRSEVSSPTKAALCCRLRGRAVALASGNHLIDSAFEKVVDRRRVVAARSNRGRPLLKVHTFAKLSLGRAKSASVLAMPFKQTAQLPAGSRSYHGRAAASRAVVEGYKGDWLGSPWPPCSRGSAGGRHGRANSTSTSISCQ